LAGIAFLLADETLEQFLSFIGRSLRSQ